MSKDIRWKQRFENFGKALAMLHKAVDAYSKEPKNHLYEIAVIGAFQFTFEMGWKTLKDYMSQEGIETSFPREVIKRAYNARLITDGQAWIDMLEDRNIMAYGYDQAKANTAATSIRTRYAPAIEQVYGLLKQKLDA